MFTPILTALFPQVISVDLSMRMLQQANGRSSWRVRAGASRLPLTDASGAVIAAIDMLLFPAETARVLAPGGVLLWINQFGCYGPLHLPAATVVEALPGTWQATEAEAGWGYSLPHWSGVQRSGPRTQAARHGRSRFSGFWRRRPSESHDSSSTS
ncbi:methyltransferase domain-containing protein [Streptomyces mirabilis]|uniref:methyltransferase domain-containing protein n=1 Tax=Streptomyces mirabilis TaxID=68239 RepID=UPI0036433A5A